jgi:DNA-binding NarL/FixJ family response regulator
MNSNINIFVVDDHIGESGKAADAINLIKRLSPDIVIMDIFLEENGNGLDLTRTLKYDMPHVKTIILTVCGEKIYVERALKAGARGFLTKDMALKKLEDAIKTVYQGDLYFDKILKGMIKEGDYPEDNLTKREYTIFRLLGEGLKTGEISLKLKITKSTVESHKNNIKIKLGIRSNYELTKHAIHWLLTLSRISK